MPISLSRLAFAGLVASLIITAGTLTRLPADEPLLDGREGRDLLLRLFRPRPAIRVPRTEITQARFPVVDVHTHFRVRRRNIL